MKIYKHIGNGVSLGSCIVVAAQNIAEAAVVMHELMISRGIGSEFKLDEVEQVKLKRHETVVIYFDDGDY